MSTFAQIKSNIQDNLQDYSIHWSNADLTNAVQDAYDETICMSQCLIKKTTLSFQDNLNYYDFLNLPDFPNIYISDFMATTAIFNNNTNLWLLDNKVLKDFDRDRLDWENWTGEAIWWVPCNDSKKNAFVPKQPIATGNFDIYYWAQAPTVVDSETPLVPVDFHSLIELHATGALLELAREFTKARAYFEEFWGIDDGEQNLDEGIYLLASRSKNIAKSDLLMLG